MVARRGWQWDVTGTDSIVSFQIVLDSGFFSEVLAKFYFSVGMTNLLFDWYLGGGGNCIEVFGFRVQTFSECRRAAFLS